MGIREWRERKGLSRDQLSKQIGYAEVTIGRWERGDRSPDGKALKAMAATLGCKADDLLDPPPPPALPRRGRKRAGRLTSTQ